MLSTPAHAARHATINTQRNGVEQIADGGTRNTVYTEEADGPALAPSSTRAGG